MKKLSLVLALVFVLSLFSTAAFAAGEENDALGEVVAAVEELVESAGAKTAAPASDIPAIYGNWYGVSYVGIGELALGGDFYFLPDGSISDGTMSLPAEMTDESHFVISVSEEEVGIALTGVTGECGTLTEEMIEEYKVEDRGFFDVSIGAPCITVTASMMDSSNPLAPTEVSATTLFLKRLTQEDFLEMVMLGKTWKIGENTLTIDSEGQLDLNSGAVTGSASWLSEGDMPMTVRFSWDSGADVKYVPTAMDEGSITLVNIENPDDIQVLELQGEAPAAAPEEAPAA